MKVYRKLNDPELETVPRCVAIGIFDGVHKGHRRILEKVVSEAKKKKMRSMVVTFEPHPGKVLYPQKKAHPVILSLEHRLRIFGEIGLEEALVIGFNKKFSKISHNSFLNKFLLGRLGMRALVVGYDFRFGRKGLGDSSFLRRESEKRGFDFEVVGPLRHGRTVISSTRIRHLIEKGDLKNASKMLGRRVSLYGTVVPGRRRGRQIGFPTANINPHHETLPPTGVYAVWGVLDGKRLKGALHIGKRPTFGDGESAVEVHLLDFGKSIYGKDLELLFVSKLRPTRHFKSPKELTAAIRRDVLSVTRNLK